MTINRFYRNTLGIGAEIVVARAASALEAGSAGAASGAVPSTAVVPITIGASPTIGESVTLTIDGVSYTYTVPAGGATTQQAHDGIKTVLQGNAQGFIVSLDSGTTSSSYTLSWAGVDKNAKVIALSEVGTTFTVGSNVAFAGGVAGDAISADTIADFITNEVAGAIWAYWDDTNTALVAGDTANSANKDRKFFYAYKLGDGTYKRTSAIPVESRKYASATYVAGTALVKKIVFGGTYSTGQIVYVKVINTVVGNLPYPFYTYQFKVPAGGINDVVTGIAALINAEPQEPIVTATASTNELTVTAKDKNVSFKLSTEIEIVPGATTDATAPVLSTVTPQVLPVGTVDQVGQLEIFMRENLGDPIYQNKGVLSSEFSAFTSNVVGGTQYGFLIVTNDRSERGEVRNYTKRNYAIVALASADVAKLAAL